MKDNRLGQWLLHNGPATGEAMAERIADGQTSTVDLTAFNRARLPDYQ